MNFIRQQYLRIFHRDRFRNQSGGSTKRRDEIGETAAVATNNEAFELEDFIELEEMTYSECENIEQAIAMIESCEKLENTDKVFLLTIQLYDTFGSIDAKMLVQKYKRNSMVIFLESKAGKKFSILWKSKDVESFCVFGHYSMAFDETDRQVYKFIADFLAKSLTRRHLEINSACENEKVLLTDISDYRGFSLLLVAIEQNNTEMAKIMLNLGASAESQDGTVTAQSLAWNLRNSELLLQMAKSNMKYPVEVNLIELSEDFRGFYKETEELHAAIMAEDKEKIEEFFETNQHRLRFYFNLDNESAASVAIKQGSHDIYEILLKHGVFLAEDGLLSELSDDYQRIVRGLHTKYKKESDDKHINFLYSRSHAAHDALDAQGNMKHVMKAYELMAQNPLLNIILRVVAAVRRFDIIYDFSRDATNVIDPTTTENTEGIFYIRGQIFIGAKQLLNEENKFQAICVIAHELCHFACNILYDNDAQPFAKDDVKTRKWFEEINTKCKANKNKNKIVRLVYDCYPPDMFLAELIVRVPHMLALYFDQPEKQRECRASYPELLNFYETHLVPKMEEAIPEIETRTEREIEEKDEKIFKYKFLWIISIILAIFGIIVTIFIVRAIFFKPVYTFNTLDPAEQQKVRDGLIVYKGIKLKLHDLFANNSLTYQNLTSDHITQIFEGKNPLDFSSPYLGYLDSQVQHNWQNMSKKLKGEALKSKFTFQNESLTLYNLAESVPNAFDSLTNAEIVEILDGNLIIDMMIANDTKFYVERKISLTKIFTPEELNLTEDDYTNFWLNVSVRDEVNRLLREQLISLNLITNNTKWEGGKGYSCDPCFEARISYDINDAIELIELSLFFILSDEAGSGKSVKFQQMTMELKKRYPGHWVSYLDLKDYTRFYDSKKILEDPLGVLEKILDLKTKSQFELKVFEELFKTGKVILFWDGFDEISPTYSNEVIALMKFVYKNLKNIQFVCTRPVYADRLEKSFNATSRRLEPYTKSQQVEFLRKFFISEEVQDSEISYLTEKVLNISTELKYETPLMLTLIAEVHEDLRNVESPNLYKIYEAFVEKKIRIWQEKSESNKKIAGKFLAKNINLLQIYQKYAITKEIKSYNLPRLIIMKTKIPKELTFDEISRMGILHINTETEYAFSHRTFGEFFVAQFLVENFLELEDYKLFDENIFDFFHYADISPVIVSLLSDYLKDQNFDGTGHFHPEIERLLRQKHKNFFFSMLRSYIGKPFLGIFRMLLLILSKDHNLLVDMLHINEDETLYTSFYSPSKMSDWTEYNDISPEDIENATAALLTDDEILRFRTGKDQKGVILYGMANRILEDREMTHPNYSLGDVNVTLDYVHDFYENIKDELTEKERKNLLAAMLSHPFYDFADILLESFPLYRYEKLWMEGEKLLGKEDIKSIIADMLDLVDKTHFQGYSKLLSFILDKASAILSDEEIFELYKTKQLMLKPFISFPDYVIKYYKKLSHFLLSHTNKEQQKVIILQEFEICVNETYENMQERLFDQKNRVKLFHFLLLDKFSTELGLPLSNWFSEAEIRRIILSSNDFMLTMVKKISSHISDFLKALEKLFIGHEEDLIEFLKRRFIGTDYTFSSAVEESIKRLETLS